MERSKNKRRPVARRPSPREDPPAGELTPIRDVLQTVLSDPSMPFNPDDARIFDLWDRVVGPAISRNARPSWIREGRLRVRVSGPIWLQELEFAAETIRDRLNQALGRRAVEKIEFRLGDPSS